MSLCNNIETNSFAVALRGLAGVTQENPRAFKGGN